MKNLKQLLALTLSLCICVLSGCSADEKTFLSNMFGKEIKSYVSTGTLETKLTAVIPSDYKEDIKPFNLQSLLNALSDLKIVWGETTAYNNDTDITSKATLGVQAPDFSFVTNSYVYTQNDKFIYAFDIPTVMRPWLPEKYENVKKAYYDLDEIMADAPDFNNSAFEFKRLISESYKLQKDYKKVFMDYGEYMKSIDGAVKKTGNTFTITLTDSQLKDVVDDVVKTYCTNKNARESSHTVLKGILAIYKGMYSTEFYEETFGELENYVNTVSDDYLSEYYGEFAKSFEKFREIKLLGDKGMTLAFTFTPSGFIKNVNAEIDAVIDISGISKLNGEEEYTEDFYINGLIKYNQDITDINSVKKADIPSIDYNSAVNIKDWIEECKVEYPDYEYEYPENHIKNVELPAQNGEITLFDDYYKIDTMGLQPRIIDGKLYAPLEPLLKSKYMSCYWDNEAKEMVIPSHSNNYFIKPDSNVIYTDNYTITLSDKVINIDGFLYVPLRSFVNAMFNDKVFWHSEYNAAVIGVYDFFDIFLGEDY